MQLSYDGYAGVQNPWRKLTMLNATEYALIQNEVLPLPLTVPFADPYAFGEGAPTGRMNCSTRMRRS